MNCNDCIEHLDSYVDRELNNTEMLELKLHLETCPPCADQYDFQVHLKRLVKVCCDKDEVPPAFREKLRQILL
ncbi:MAG TPA: mycothiol system anti-sigma-R factor [Candidatus Limnocylindria bacterium]|jgi:mycothiol system anti-sigma-R factor|nr:mycothiol system anti-sigma-R factor [Candidatus Limnocylindria bacterium]